MRLLAILSNKQMGIVSVLEDISDSTQQQETNISNKIDSIRDEIITAIQQEQSLSPGRKELCYIGTMCQDMAEEGNKIAASQRILNSLYFKSIRVRQTAIKDAHAKTFQWIFESSLDSSQPRSTFLDWLKRGKDIYWVSGKAGSGKSTLVKYLCDHKHTRGALETCASEEKLVMASYFFWISGTMMQKSQEGLLQSLLYRILQQCPHLIPTICPSRWNKPAMLLERDSWTRQELLQAFNVLSEEGNLSTKFCLFIDGLDEYDGEHTDIIRILQNFANSSSIKLCISSRPWNPFIEAFGRKVDQKMLLQDFTKADIKLYVKSQLQEDRRFLELMKSDSRYHLLIKDIIDKAQGMFLWVYLVVRSLLRGLTDDNDIVTLQLRVKKLPADLETFFKQIFDTVEDVYLEQTAQIFQIAVYALSPPPILAYAFLKKEAGDPNYEDRGIK